jgi:hypothetical protein
MWQIIVCFTSNYSSVSSTGWSPSPRPSSIATSSARYSSSSTPPYPQHHAGLPPPKIHHHLLQPNRPQRPHPREENLAQSSALHRFGLYQQHPHQLLRDRHASGCLHGLQEVCGFFRASGGHPHGHSQYLQQGASLLHIRHRRGRTHDWWDRYLQGIIPGLRLVTDLHIPGSTNPADIDLAVPEARY